VHKALRGGLDCEGESKLINPKGNHESQKSQIAKNLQGWPGFGRIHLKGKLQQGTGLILKVGTEDKFSNDRHGLRFFKKAT